MVLTTILLRFDTPNTRTTSAQQCLDSKNLNIEIAFQCTANVNLLVDLRSALNMEGSLHAKILQSPTSKSVFRKISYCTSESYAGDTSICGALSNLM